MYVDHACVCDQSPPIGSVQLVVIAIFLTQQVEAAHLQRREWEMKPPWSWGRRRRERWGERGREGGREGERVKHNISLFQCLKIILK